MSISLNHQAGVSWGAILAGASCAASLSFLLLMLGFGLGLSAVSPWTNAGASLAVIGISSILWVSFTQIAASGLGGYIAGRLRVRWDGVHSDEVYFRDTAHGLITWAVSTLLAAALFASTLGNVFSGGVNAGAQLGSSAMEAAASGVAATGAASAGDNYFPDALLRPANNNQMAAPGEEVRTELAIILMRGLAEGELRADDSQYLASVVARYTGVSQSEASTRVSQIYQRAQQAADDMETAAREAADTARKTAAYTALWMVIALMCGAFTASLLATHGGRQRDDISIV